MALRFQVNKQRRVIGLGPPGRVFVLTIERQSPLSQAEQLSTFRSANGVGPHDHLVVITFN
jgi:hypothetical protein